MFQLAYKEMLKLNKRFRWINIEEEISEENRNIDYLLTEADWEIEQINYDDGRIQEELESEGKSEKQIDRMKKKSIEALEKYINKYSNTKN